MKIAIVCYNEEEAHIVIRLLYKNGFKWSSDAIFSKYFEEDIRDRINETYWNEYAIKNIYEIDDDEMSIACLCTVDDVGLVMNASDFINIMEYKGE